MPLCVNSSFAGYDKEKKAVLLKGPFGAIYFLLPKWSGDRPTMESEEMDEDSDYVGSSCSESYVSSASTYSNSSSNNNNNSNEKNGMVASGSSVYGEEDTVNELTLECEGIESNVGEEENTVLPLHGTVMQLRETYRNNNKEELPFYLERTESDNDYRVENYFTPVFLGYDEHKNVFLLPTPYLSSENGICAYRFSPILQISYTELCHYYSWDFNPNNNEHGNISISFDLPLGKEYMKSPILDQVTLQNVFGVSTKKVYYLSLWSVRVQFVGVAWGLPWVIRLPYDSVNNDSLSAVKESCDNYCIEPLLYCYGERPLCEIYGLCESQKDVSVPFTTLPPSLHSASAVNRKEKQKPLWEEYENQLEKDEKKGGATAESTTSSFASCGDFIPRGTNYSAKLNKKDGISAVSPPGFFLRGDKLICCGSFGVTQDCDMSPEALERFGVLHGDYLKGNAGRIFEGREAMVLGVHMGSLVVMLDDDVRTTTLRNVQGKEDLKVLFSGVGDLLCTIKEDGTDSVEENKEVTPLPPMESVSEGDNDGDKTKNADVDEEESDVDEQWPLEEEKPNEGEAVIVEEVKEVVPNTRVSESPGSKVPLCETEEPDVRQRETTPEVVVESGYDSDDAVDVKIECGVREANLSPPPCVVESGTPATTPRENSERHQERTVLLSDERMEENKEVTPLPPMESVSEGDNDGDKTKNADVEEEESDVDEQWPLEEEKPNEGGAVIVEEVERHRVEDQLEVEDEISQIESFEFSNSFAFTKFLKAVAYWKMGIFSAEEQRQQHLAFVKYYGTNTQKRMMEAVELFRKYKYIFPGLEHNNSCISASDNKECRFNTSIQEVVQLLNQHEGVRVL